MIKSSRRFVDTAVNDNGARKPSVRLPFRLKADLPDDLLERPGLNRSDIRIDPHQVLIRREMSGLPLTLTVPLASYSGVAAKIHVQDAVGEMEYHVILLHRDTALSVPLYRGGDMEEAAERWEVWSETLALPLLVIDGDGHSRLTHHGLSACSPNEPLPRRKLRALTGRRPRFLVNRKSGKPSAWQRMLSSSRRLTGGRSPQL